MRYPNKLYCKRDEPKQTAGEEEPEADGECVFGVLHYSLEHKELRTKAQ